MVNIKTVVGITFITAGTILGIVSNNAYDRELDAVVRDLSLQMSPHVKALFISEPGSDDYIEAKTKMTELRAQMPDYDSNTAAIFGVTGGLVLGLTGLGFGLREISESAGYIVQRREEEAVYD